MSIQTGWQLIGSSRVALAIARRPRLVMTILLVLVGVAVQGSVVAEECTTCNGGSSDTGP